MLPIKRSVGCENAADAHMAGVFFRQLTDSGPTEEYVNAAQGKKPMKLDPSAFQITFQV